jgi:nucleotide sugar dehydrogenase
MKKTIEQKEVQSLKEPKILIIGLGQIGYSNAEYMTKLGLQVDGMDLNQNATKRALDNKVIKKDAKDFSGYDYYLICISTHHPENMFIPFLDGIFSIVKRISIEGKWGALVGIDSTITRGTSEKIDLILGHRLHVVHVPHRFYVHEQETHGVNQKRVLGGCKQCCIDEGYEFYQNILKIRLRIVSSIQIAEMTKIVENSYRFMEIAFAEELKIICDRTNLNFRELRNAVNSKWNINILEAKDGIGGHCLPKDSQMLLNISEEILQNSILTASKKIDSEYRRHIQKKYLIPQGS